MTRNASSYDTWHTDPKGDAEMADSHAPYWRHMIESVPERDFTTKTVLDFGCNRGGFLRLLYTLQPFHRGIGVDIAQDSVQAANQLKGTMPLDFAVSNNLEAWHDRFDIAFSYEVIYLLADLRDHAEQVFQAMKQGGIYYAVTGCHTECPLWPVWRERIAAVSNAPVQDHAPQDFINAFDAAGFDVSVKRFGYDGFVPAPKNRDYYPSILDAIAYPADHKLLFRLEKQDNR